ncbi:hypothetical protein [Rothia halotolerans]|uniref:hypothetical protein n=1 Tax=Rothia halotolerans TaxID=405770 RepID=UPI0013ECBEF2|nr:hypothetical protein [Rothia halotolerans]
MRTAADVVVETTGDAGSRSVRGLPGDPLGGFTAALRASISRRDEELVGPAESNRLPRLPG